MFIIVMLWNDPYDSYGVQPAHSFAEGKPIKTAEARVQKKMKSYA